MLALRDEYTKPPTTWELSQAFPECRDVAGRVIYCLEKELESYKPLIDKEPLIKDFMQIDPRVIRLKELHKFMSFTKPTVSGKINQDDMQKAKSVPIEEIYDFKISHRNSARIQCICPFHYEKTASFYIFKEQNKCHCFSCGFNGDVIDFVRKLKSMSFVESIRFLIGE